MKYISEQVELEVMDRMIDAISRGIESACGERNMHIAMAVYDEIMNIIADYDKKEA